jgi:hypothetical protein
VARPVKQLVASGQHKLNEQMLPRGGLNLPVLPRVVIETDGKPLLQRAEPLLRAHANLHPGSLAPHTFTSPSTTCDGFFDADKERAKDPTTVTPLACFGGPQGRDAVSGDVLPGTLAPPEFSDSRLDRWVAGPLAGDLQKQSDAEVMKAFTSEFRFAAHYSKLGDSQAAHFKGGTGDAVTSGPGSKISEVMRTSAPGQRLARDFTERLQTAAETQLTQTGNVNPDTLQVLALGSDRPNFYRRPWNPLIAVLGGTDGVRAELAGAKFDPATQRLTGTMQVTVIDRFGLDDSDSDTPGQRAMWVAQHERGVRSFENQIRFDVPISLYIEPRNTHHSTPFRNDIEP